MTEGKFSKDEYKSMMLFTEYVEETFITEEMHFFLVIDTMREEYVRSYLVKEAPEYRGCAT